MKHRNSCQESEETGGGLHSLMERIKGKRSSLLFLLVLLLIIMIGPTLSLIHI